MKNSQIKTLLLMRGNTGKEVSKLKKALRKLLPDADTAYPGLVKGSDFNADTEAALRTWQASVGLVADGIAGPYCLSALGIATSANIDVALDTAMVSRLLPYARSSSIEKNLPYVTAALAAFGLTDADMLCLALSTIAAETEGFSPIAELPSHFNTLPGQAAFSAYENINGNKDMGDGARYRGRGYVQLNGLDNYKKFGDLLDIDLTDNPDIACAPEVAACLLAAHLESNGTRIQAALAANDLPGVRAAVNGEDHSQELFTKTFLMAQEALAPKPLASRAIKAAAPSLAVQSTLNVTRDAKDIRDHLYMPPPHSLPQIFPADDDIRKFMGVYSKAGLILDQGQEGACTGFGLACVINYLRWKIAGMPEQFESVSPRMLYHFAQRFDEYEGEDYSGSSCRGALKGWYYNGVCLKPFWTYKAGTKTRPKSGWDSDAIEQTLGVYYRIDIQTITDLQAAILEVGAIYVSAYTHPGWYAVKRSSKPPSSHADLPVIPFDGPPSRSGGHAFALVGFNRDGFIIQNSWGDQWGIGGFAVISYADWLTHGMDAWVTALGVPGVVSGRLIKGGSKQMGSASASMNSSWWKEDQAYQHSIVLGNNGRVNQFDTVDGMTRTLQHQACVMPNEWFRANPQPVKRLVIYAHGGLNSQSAAIERAQAMGRYFIGNGCYPLFLVWKSGLLESIKGILADKADHGTSSKAGGMFDWINDKISDPVVEKTIGRPFARPLWTEMKENAELASEDGRGGDLLTDALKSLVSSWGDKFEIHLIGHSAGSIILGRLLENMEQKGLSKHIKSMHLYAPACTVSFANRYYAPHDGIMSRLYLDILADQQERDDNVAYLYQKSLLYFISNALESDARIPIIGMSNVYNPDFNGWDGSSSTAEALTNWRNAVQISDLAARITRHDSQKFISRKGNGVQVREKSDNPSHGGFDNNINIINKTLERITGAPLVLPVDDLVGF